MNSNFKQTDIGLIPEDWDWIKLGDENRNPLLELKNGLTDPQTENESKYRVTRIETISNESIDLERTKYIENITDEKIDKYRIRRGDILFSHINSDPHIGKSAIAKRDYYDLLHGLNLLLFRTNDEVLYPEFLNFIFNYYRSIGIFIKICSRAVNQSSINQGKLKSLFIPLPPLPEQKNIAHILSRIQQAIETQEQIIKTTQELKKALMQKLFTEGLSAFGGTNGEPQKQSAFGGEIGPIPESWEVIEIKNCVEESQTRNPSLLPNKYIKYIDVSSVSNQSFSVVDHQYVQGKEAPGRARKIVKTDDIIFATIRPTLKRIAKIKSFYDDEYCSTAFCILRCKSKVLDHEFLFQYIITDFFIQRIGKLQSGANYPAVRDDNVKQMIIPLPQLKEQKEIARILSSLDGKIEFHSNFKIQLQDLFKSMLSQLMIGQIRVKDIEFELEESLEGINA